MGFSPVFLRTQVVAGLLRYLAVIHHGRGRGKFIESDAPAFWQVQVETALREHEEALTDALDNRSSLASAQLTDVLNEMALTLLARLYPDD